jgi:hypothetical protein
MHLGGRLLEETDRAKRDGQISVIPEPDDERLDCGLTWRFLHSNVLDGDAHALGLGTSFTLFVPSAVP